MSLLTLRQHYDAGDVTLEKSTVSEVFSQVFPSCLAQNKILKYKKKLRGNVKTLQSSLFIILTFL